MMPPIVDEQAIYVQNTEAIFCYRKHIIETAARIWPELKQVETS